ncbi:MaoC family dehydratase N-terminal domain-containing protein [Roseomonas aerophila]|uniref:MaoC family dehydratase N-terminal domain-containing protein n=1 Tax=Teichococcus aerophilus TaxID=1224513 RepID=A0ABR7RKQ4_9PROT|nr:MaoC family dehydratase [Pseudoroseomonas aerophila]MBC9206993.1 MaoC family dehydratase N-terminal domain-containing protein [Pseudoroseomonas aerophila]
MMPLDPMGLMALSIPQRNVVYAGRDSLMYALTVGMAASGEPDDLPFVWEREQRVIPSMATMLAFDDSWLDAAGIDLKQVVHGGLDLHFHAPLAPEGEALVETRIAGLDDKGAGKAGLVFAETVLSQGAGPACTILSTIFVRGAGGFGGAVGEQATFAKVPDGAPDVTSQAQTACNQALLFRLLGDRNPLHVDPALARQVGFERPILHGACTFGIACAEVLRVFCGLEPARLRRFAARFAGPLYPGETLAFSFWRNGNRIAFRATAAERAAIVLDSGLAELAD